MSAPVQAAKISGSGIAAIDEALRVGLDQFKKADQAAVAEFYVGKPSTREDSTTVYPFDASLQALGGSVNPDVHKGGLSKQEKNLREQAREFAAANDMDFAEIAPQGWAPEETGEGAEPVGEFVRLTKRGKTHPKNTVLIEKWKKDCEEKLKATQEANAAAAKEEVSACCASGTCTASAKAED